MKDAVRFLFHGNLRDFLSADKAGSDLLYKIKVASPSVKDAMEALGVPHPEVYAIVVNAEPVNFDYKVKVGDLVDVYPAPPATDWTEAKGPGFKKFVLDVHLGKLAKALRMLGFDTSYKNDYSDHTIADIAANENRIVLTRDIGLLKHKVVEYGYWLRSQHLEEQLSEVINYFHLRQQFKHLSRCLVCNTLLKSVEKEEVLELLPPKTRQFFDKFYQCPTCRRVYWKGSHYDRMKNFIARLHDG